MCLRLFGLFELVRKYFICDSGHFFLCLTVCVYFYCNLDIVSFYCDLKAYNYRLQLKNNLWVG